MIDHARLIPLEILHTARLSDVGLPVIEAGESGMKGYRGVLVPSYSFPGELSVLWHTEFNGGELGKGRMQTGITYGTVPDIETRIGFLMLVDYAEGTLGLTDISHSSSGRRVSMGDIRSLRLENHREEICASLMDAIVQAHSTP